jgi:peptide/nickel transport system permease protein
MNPTQPSHFLSRWLQSDVGYSFRQSKTAMAAAGIAFVFIFCALFAKWVSPYNPFDAATLDLIDARLPPAWMAEGSTKYLLGTDDQGRDILSRVLVATRIDFVIALSAVLASFVAGGLLGACAGYFGGWFDRIIMRACDMVMSFPLFVLAMGIVAALGNSVANIILATAVVNLPFYIRVARAEANVRRNAGWVEAARLSGNSDWRILAFHLFPNALPPAMVQLSLNMGWAILNAAGLSFIGLGVRPPEAEWGILVAEGAQFIVSGEWWVSLFPGAALMLAVFTFNLLGDAMRDVFDPRKRT